MISYSTMDGESEGFSSIVGDAIDRLAVGIGCGLFTRRYGTHGSLHGSGAWCVVWFLMIALSQLVESWKHDPE